METIAGKLLKPVTEAQLNSHKKEMIKKSEQQSFIIIFSYFLITFLILFSLYVTNSKHTLLLFSYKVHFLLLFLFSSVIQEFF